MSERPMTAGSLPDLARTVAERKRRRRLHALAYWTTQLVWSIAVIWFMPTRSLAAAFGIVLLWSLPAGWMLGRLREIARADLAALTAAVAMANDAAVVPALLDCLATLDRTQECTFILAKLAELAPRMDESAVASLADAQWATVRKAIESIDAIAATPRGSARAALVALIGLVARGGHYQALPQILAVAGHTRDAGIRIAAKACVDRLCEVKLVAVQSGALLRPADAPTGDTLLRAAEPVAEGQLLRPAKDGK